TFMLKMGTFPWIVITLTPPTNHSTFLDHSTLHIPSCFEEFSLFRNKTCSYVLMSPFAQCLPSFLVSFYFIFSSTFNYSCFLDQGSKIYNFKLSKPSLEMRL